MKKKEGTRSLFSCQWNTRVKERRKKKTNGSGGFANARVVD